MAPDMEERMPFPIPMSYAAQQVISHFITRIGQEQDKTDTGIEHNIRQRTF